MIINNAGYKFTHENSFRIHRPKGSGDYAVLFLRTSAVFTLDGVEVEAVPQSFILYKKGTPQFFRANGDKFINDWLHFDMTEAEEKKITEKGIPFDIPVCIGDITFFSRIIKNMYQEKYSVNPYKKEILELYFNLIMIKLAERLSLPLPQGNNPHYENICALRAKIYNIPNFGWTVENMAHSMMLSESYFQHLYKQIFGVSPLGDVICARIDRAQYLLSSTDYKLNRIAAECGYKSDIHFMRQFKKEIGITPSEYRKRFYLSADKKEEMYKKAPYKILPQ